MSYTGIHFNISERKVLLRVFDVLLTLVVLYGLSNLFDFDYFTITKENWTWVFVLVLYLSIFATVFELYDLQKSSKIENIIPNVILTVSDTALFYFLTRYFTPVLPDIRLHILYFYFVFLFAISMWR